MLFYDPPSEVIDKGRHLHNERAEVPQFYNSQAAKGKSEEIKPPVKEEGEDKKEGNEEIEQHENYSAHTNDYSRGYYNDRHDYYPRQGYGRRGRRRGRNTRPYYDRGHYNPRYTTQNQVFDCGKA